MDILLQMTKKLYFIFTLLMLGCFVNIGYTATQSETKTDNRSLYQEMELDGLISFTAFDQAMVGYAKIEAAKKGIITVIDFSKPSCDKRMAVIDLKQKRLLYASYVSHGRNSGENYATSFSNKSGSHQSSLGFYVTETTYQGKNGYSLVLDGLEKGINDHAKDRAIVIHGATYADPDLISSMGRLGRSYGCPALPPAVCKKIIDTIKDGSMLFIYANNTDYLAHSSILR